MSRTLGADPPLPLRSVRSAMKVTQTTAQPAAGSPICFLVTGVGGALTARVNGGAVPVSVTRTNEGWMVCFVPPASGPYQVELASGKRQTAAFRVTIP